MQKAAEADRARLRRILHRVTWFEMTFYPMPEDPCRAVVELWSNAGTSTKVACEILDVDLAGLVVLSMELLVPPRPGVSMIVTPAGLPDSVLERIRKLARRRLGGRRMTDDAKRLARQIIRKRLDRTVAHPELRPTDFIAAWLDGDVRCPSSASAWG